MIENPQVGQRVFKLFFDGTGEWTTVEICYRTFHGTDRIVHHLDSGGCHDDILDDRFYDSPQSAVAALRAEAQRLNALAEKLESEAVDNSVCYCGDLMRDHKAYGSCTSPRAMPTESALKSTDA